MTGIQKFKIVNLKREEIRKEKEKRKKIKLSRGPILASGQLTPPARPSRLP